MKKVWFSGLLVLLVPAPLALAIDNVKHEELVKGDSPTTPDKTNHGELLTKWLRSRGAFINPKLEIRAEPTDPTSKLRVFTKEKIEHKEMILEVPSSCFITAASVEKADDVQENLMDCGTVRSLIKEIRLGDASDFAPYINYLLADSKSQLPSAWSKEGKALLKHILEHFSDETLPPIEATDWINYEWRELCKGSSDPFEEDAALMVVQRSRQGVLIPLYDIMSHRNGDWLNSEVSKFKETSTSLKVRAKRTIEAGEEIYMSHNICKNCVERTEEVGTPQILRDYGVVEQYPQRWIFPNEDMRFDIDKNDTDWSVSWIGDPPNPSGIKFLRVVQSGLWMCQETTLKETYATHEHIPSTELTTILQFHQSYLKAVTYALETVNKDSKECDADGKTCAATTKYVDLTKETDELELDNAICDSDVFLSSDDYVDIDQIASAYQKIGTFQNPATKDTCFDLDNTVQICGSYRPHYHEMVVHYTARFIPVIKRVLFVGGGDSMLLHEILKYSTLEVVVGLELDQQVTRNAFKHFGAQPHWDNEIVEWWYGDACKSILMLPKDYFGSFDMVLVDLSETVMSFKVTNELDIMQALSLLLNPNGIMVKNELYFQNMTDVFVHTSQIHYYDVPVICSQALSLGSTGLNFLQQPLTDHNINSKNLFIKPLEVDEHVGLIHDYKYSPDNLLKQCNEKYDIMVSEEPKTQKKSPGIIMIVEAEDMTSTFEELKDVSDLLLNVFEKEGFTVVSTIMPEGNLDEAIVFILKEGYVVSKIWGKHKYCSFDIHLWSSFGKHKRLKEALVSSVGSSNESSSSYRIVAGGMFGVTTWKMDEKNRGPHHTIPCDRISASSSSTAMNQGVLDLILEKSMSFFHDRDNVILVVCGLIESKPCRSLELLKTKEDFGEIQVIWSCPNTNEFAEDFAQNMRSCEVEVLQTLRKALTNHKKIQAIVIDSQSSYHTGQVLFKLFSSIKNRMEILMENTTVIGLYQYDEKDTWKKIFINRFRKEILTYDPIFKGEVFFNNSDTAIELSIVSKGRQFVKNLNSVISVVEKQTGFVSEIKNVLGGFLHENGGYTFSQFFLPKDYDQRSPLNQWSSQKPLENQTIFQLEDSTTNSELSSSKVRDAFEKVLFKKSEDQFLPGRVEVKEFSNLGDGSVLVALWPGSRAIVIWDGKVHIDINLCTRAVNDSFSEDFKDLFIQQIPSLKVVLQDVQPRGFGRVVNFLKDTQSTSSPHWA